MTDTTTVERKPDGSTQADWDILLAQADRIVERSQAMAAPKQKAAPTQPEDSISTERMIELSALRIDADFATAVKALQDRRDLTASGKQQHFAKLESDRQAKVTALQSQAHDLTDSRRSAAQAKLQAVKVSEFEKLRATLGDAVLSDITRRRLAVRTPGEIRQMIADATEGFERILLQQLALVEFETRVLGSENPAHGDMVALTELRELATSPAIVQAESEARAVPSEEWVGQLDVTKYRRDFADRIPGIVAEHVPPPF